MALPTSGNLSLSQVIAEFGGGTKLRDFFRGGGRVPNTPTNSGVPTSGTISLRQLLGASKTIPFTPTYTSYSGTQGIEIAPSGCTKVRIMLWGGGGAGGGVFGGNQGARGGDGGALAISEYPCVGGQTLEFVVGWGGETVNQVAFNGEDSTVYSGSLAITTMTAAGGTHGNGPASNAVASGGNISNTPGNTGSLMGNPIYGNGPGADQLYGSIPATGQYWGAGGGGTGGRGNYMEYQVPFDSGEDGEDGLVVFYYT